MWNLTVEFLYRTSQRGKIVSEKRSGHRYGYSGKTKAECINKAKNALHWGPAYLPEWKKDKGNANGL